MASFFMADSSIEELINVDVWTVDDSADFSRSFRNEDDDPRFFFTEEDSDDDLTEPMEIPNEPTDSEPIEEAYFYDWFHEFDKEYDV
jgi:hypothetical protein